MTHPPWHVQLIRVVCRSLCEAELDPPRHRETEEPFTERVLVPHLRALVDRVGSPHLLVGGHHAGINLPIGWAGAQFHPDLSIIYRGRRVMAIEVKVLRGRDRSGAIAKAIGQAVIYSTAKDAFGLAFIIDTVGAPIRTYVEDAANGHIGVIVRNSKSGGLRTGNLLLI